MATGWNVHLLDRYASATAHRFFDTPASIGLGRRADRNPVLDGFAATPVLKYESFAKFQGDIDDGKIRSWTRWVLYDSEKWPLTPLEEQEDPWTYLRLFSDLAHAHGYKVMLTPARDLGLVSGSVNPRRPGENLDAWYLRNRLAETAAGYADMVSVQSQAVTLDLAEFRSFLTQARDQAKAANPHVRVFGGVSTNYGTAVQMAAAAKSVAVDGYWLNASSDQIAKAEMFLRYMDG